MKLLCRVLLPALLAVVCAAPPATAAELIVNGTFTDVRLTSTGQYSPTLYGQFGDDTVAGSPASGSRLTLNSWSTNGYNFVFLPGTVDYGSGSPANTPTQTPGQYSNTFMWGTNNGGPSVITAPPGGGNYLAADGAFETAAIKQTLTGLQPGGFYQLNFYWAAAQQQSFDKATQERWDISFGTDAAVAANTAQRFSTPTYQLGEHQFSGWMAGATSTGGQFNFTATAATQVLSFLAAGSPTGLPPFSMLAQVSLVQVPEPSGWLLLVLGGVLLTVLAVIHRRRVRTAGDGVEAALVTGVDPSENDSHARGAGRRAPRMGNLRNGAPQRTCHDDH